MSSIQSKYCFTETFQELNSGSAYLLTYLPTYLLIYLLHGAESFLRKKPVLS